MRKIILIFAILQSLFSFSQTTAEWNFTKDAHDINKQHNFTFWKNGNKVLSSTQFIDHELDILNDEISLTTNSRHQSGTIYYNKPINLGSCGQWHMEFEIRAFKWWGRPADGIAFAFLRDRPAGIAKGESLGLPMKDNYGFVLVYDTYANNRSNKGIPILQLQEISPTNSYKEPRVSSNGIGSNIKDGIALPIKIHKINRKNGYHKIRLDYDNGNIKVYANSRFIMNYKLKYDYLFEGYMLFSAATGGSTDWHSIKNAKVVIKKTIDHSLARDAFMCSGSNTLELDAGDSYDSYEWKNSSGIVVGNARKLEVTKGIYTVKKSSLCEDIIETITVKDLGNIQNPILPVVDSTYYSAIDGEDKYEIYLCGVGANREIDLNVPEASKIEWKRNGTLVGSNQKLNITQAGNYTVHIEFRALDGTTCSKDYEFDVYLSNIVPKALVVQPTCNNNGTVTVAGIGNINKYEYSLDGSTYQSSNILSVPNKDNMYTIYIKNKRGGCIYTVDNVIIVKYINMNLSLTKKDWTCHDSKDGEVQINVTGGITDYKYYILTDPSQVVGGGTLLSSTSIGTYSYNVNNFPAGVDSVTYRFYIEDIYGCLSPIETITINRPEEILFDTKVTNNSCFNLDDGKLEITNPRGGTGVLKYSLDGTNFTTNINDAIFSNLVGTTSGNDYTLTVKDDNNCVKTFDFKMFKPEKLNIVTKGVSPTCYGGIDGYLEIKVTNSNVELEYKLDTVGGSSGIFQGNNLFGGLTVRDDYILTVRYKNASNSCDEIDTVEVPEVEKPVLSSVTSVPMTCIGPGKMEIKASGGRKPYMYSINGGVTYSSDSTYIFNTPITYIVAVQDKNGCEHKYGNYKIQNTTDILNVTITDGAPLASCSGQVRGIQVKEIDTPTNKDTVPDSIRVYKFPVVDPNNSMFFLKKGIDYNATDSIIDLDPLTVIGTEKFTFMIYLGGCTYAVDKEYTSALPAAHISKKKDVTCKGFRDGEFIVKFNYNDSNIFPVKYQLTNTSTGEVFANFNKEITSFSDTVIGNGKGGIPPNGGLSVGNYTLALETATGCNLLYRGIDVSISEPAINLKLIIDTIVNTPFCKDEGIIYSHAESGWGGFNYWLEDNSGNNVRVRGMSSLPIYNNLSDGNYMVAVEDRNGCVVKTTVRDSVIILREPKFKIQNNITEVLCYGDNNGKVITIPSRDTIKLPSTYKIEGNGIDMTSPMDSTGNYTFDNLYAGGYKITIKDIDGCEVEDSAIVKEPDYLEIEKVDITKPVVCYGDSATLEVKGKGGKGAYDYRYMNLIDSTRSSWVNNKNFTLQGGNYVFEIKDVNGCNNISNQVSILSPDTSLVVGNLEETAKISCNGSNDAVISLNEAYGGVSAYNMTLLDGSGIELRPKELEKYIYTGISPGTYKIKVDDSFGCIRESSTIIITEPSVLNLDKITPTDVLCYGSNEGTVEVQGLGGVSPYQYNFNSSSRWDDNKRIENLVAGNYNYIIRDAHGCIYEDSITINEPNELTETHTVNNVGCKGDNTGEIEITINGGTMPYKVKFNNDSISNINRNDTVISNLHASMGFIEIVDANKCKLIPSNITKVEEPKNILSYNVDSKKITCRNDNNAIIEMKNISGGWDRYDYKFEKNGMLVSDWNSNNNYPNLDEGDYTVSIRSSMSTNPKVECVITENVNFVNPTELILKAEITKDIKCYGEKADIDINITGGNPNYKYSYDGLNMNLITGNNSIKLNAGDYTIRVEDVTGCKVDTAISTFKPTLFKVETNINIPLCYEDSVSFTLDVRGGVAPYEYSLDNVIYNSYIYGTLFKLPSQRSVIGYMKDAKGCIFKSSRKLTVPDRLELDYTRKFDCDNNIMNYTVLSTGGTEPYKYVFENKDIAGDIISTTNNLIPVKAGNWKLYVEDNNRCLSDEKNINVPNIEPLKLEVTKGEITEVNIEVTGGVEPYKVSENYKNFITIDGYFISNSKNSIIRVIDSNECIVIEDNFTDAPFEVINFITPNNDGINDNIQIKFIGGDDSVSDETRNEVFKKDFKYSKITIINRNGQIIKEYMGGDNGWNGIIGNGNVVSSNDYWFIVEFENGTVMSGAIRVQR